MRIHVNGESTELNGAVSEPASTESVSLESVLVALGYRGRKVAVAVNETFVPRAGWRERIIESGDRLDIVAPIQGG